MYYNEVRNILEGSIVETKKILSIDKPYLEHFNEFDFDESKMYKTATEFIIDSAKEHFSDYYSLPKTNK